MDVPTWERLGEETWVLRNPPAKPWLLANRWNEEPPPGMIEAFPALESVGLRVDPGRFGGPEGLPLTGTGPESGRLVTVPVCYEFGEDLLAVADELRMDPEEVVSLHASADYRCAAIGFCPGFPYLVGLPTELARIGRWPTPRPRVEAGSVAIAAGQAGIYPMVRPGGWSILGRTPRVCVDPDDGFFPIGPGDMVRFERISVHEFENQRGRRL